MWEKNQIGVPKKLSCKKRSWSQAQVKCEQSSHTPTFKISSFLFDMHRVKFEFLHPFHIYNKNNEWYVAYSLWRTFAMSLWLNGTHSLGSQPRSVMVQMLVFKCITNYRTKTWIGHNSQNGQHVSAPPNSHDSSLSFSMIFFLQKRRPLRTSHLPSIQTMMRILVDQNLT